MLQEGVREGADAVFAGGTDLLSRFLVFLVLPPVRHSVEQAAGARAGAAGTRTNEPPEHTRPGKRRGASNSRRASPGLTCRTALAGRRGEQEEETSTERSVFTSPSKRQLKYSAWLVYWAIESES